jgi:VanZ family protein
MSQLVDCHVSPGAVRRYGIVLALPILGWIGVLTLYPFAFTSAWPTNPLFRLLTGLSHGTDLMQNVILFIPLGVTLRWSLAGYGIRQRGQILGSMMLAGLLALGIEIAQLIIPGRTAAILDVMANTAGAGLGSRWLAPLLLPIVDQIGCWLVHLIRQTPATGVVIGLTIWLGSAGWLLQHWQRATLPTNWSDRYTLQIGAADDGRRFWPGYVSFVALYSRAFTEREAHTVDTFQEAVALQPLLAYDLKQFPPMPKGPYSQPLVAHGKPVLTQEGMRVGYERWLMSREPLRGVAAAIAQTGAFTLVARVAVGEPSRHTEGFIVNYGRGIDGHNVSLIQAGADLLVRMRLPLTRAANDRPPLRFSDVFTSSQPQVLILSYDGAVARLFVDGQQHRQQYTFGPGEALFNRWLPVETHQIGGWSIVLTFMLSLPFGLIGVPWQGTYRPLLMLIVVSVWVSLAASMVASALASSILITNLIGIVISTLLLFWLTQPLARKR